MLSATLDDMISAILVKEKWLNIRGSQRDIHVEVALYSKKGMGKRIASKHEIEYFYYRKISHTTIIANSFSLIFSKEV